MEHNMENIKVGDIVIFTMGGWNQTTIVDKVAKVTPKQFEVKGYRFWKKDGTMVGDSFKHCRIATEKDIADFKEEKHRNNLRIKMFCLWNLMNSIWKVFVGNCGREDKAG